MSSATTNPDRIACVENAAVFQHRLIDDPPAASHTTPENRRLVYSLTSQARQLCLSCPLLTECLYTAIVTHDVSGFVAGTTVRQRQEIRSRLNITVEPEDFDTLAGCFGRSRQVDHDEIVRLRHANPHESLETIAQRLGCSLSTVKRHLRKARAATEPKLAVVRPTRAQVLAAFAAVTNHTPRRRDAERAA